MANIVNIRLLASGSATEIEGLLKYLENQEKTRELLSQNLFRIYIPEQIRTFTDDDFAKFPGSFSSEVSVYDIGIGKDRINEIADSAEYGDLVFSLENFISGEENPSHEESDEWLIFMFQCAYEEPRSGFLALSKIFNEILFMWFCEGNGIYGNVHYKNAELIYDDMEDEDEEEDEPPSFDD